MNLCLQFNILIEQQGCYMTDLWFILNNELQIAFLSFNIVRRGCPCQIYMVNSDAPKESNARVYNVNDILSAQITSKT